MGASTQQFLDVLDELFNSYTVTPDVIFTRHGALLRDETILDFDDEGNLYELPVEEQSRRRTAMDAEFDDMTAPDPKTIEYWNQLTSLNERTQSAFKRVEELEEKYADRPVPLQLTLAEYQEFLSALNDIPRRFIMLKPGADPFGPLIWKEQPIEII